MERARTSAVGFTCWSERHSPREVIAVLAQGKRQPANVHSHPQR